MPVDLYMGGSEHAVLHLLYARFWHKVLYDAGVVSTPEPFAKLVHQGMILGELEFTKYVGSDGAPVSARRVRDGIDQRTGAAVTAVSTPRPRSSKRATTSCCAPTPRSASMHALTR